MFKMYIKAIVIVFVVFWCHTKAAIESNFYREESCTAKEGFCVLENECPGEITEELKPLCPSQKLAGAVCCPHIKQKDTNCFQLHNSCNEKCPVLLSLGRKGCPENSICCVLV